MDNFCTPINISLEREAKSNTTFTVKTQPWREGDIVQIDAITVSNQDKNSKIAHVGIVKGATAVYFETIALTTSGSYYPTSRTFFVPSGARIIIKIISPGSGDTYHINIWGRLYPL